MNVLVSVNISGNLHDAATYCNERGLADYLIQAERTGQYTVLLLRMPDVVRRQLGL